MSRPYIIKAGDTLGKIAKKYYGDALAYKKLGEYNHIFKPNLITVGQLIEIPSKQELMGQSEPLPEMGSELVSPHGYTNIISTFGDVRSFVKIDGTLGTAWSANHMGRAKLPFSIPLSWDKTKRVKNLYCHKKLIDIFEDVFSAIERKRLKKKIVSYGGCFNFRTKRSSGKLSTHSWGIAIDLNTDTNRMGTVGDMDERLVELFKTSGFVWGGDWTGRFKDPMHFQYCSGY